MSETETVYEEIARLGREIDAAQHRINALRRESGCPEGASLFQHLFGAPLIPTHEESDDRHP